MNGDYNYNNTNSVEYSSTTTSKNSCLSQNTLDVNCFEMSQLSSTTSKTTTLNHNGDLNNIHQLNHLNNLDLYQNDEQINKCNSNSNNDCCPRKSPNLHQKSSATLCDSNDISILLTNEINGLHNKTKKLKNRINLPDENLKKVDHLEENGQVYNNNNSVQNGNDEETDKVNSNNDSPETNKPIQENQEPSPELSSTAQLPPKNQESNINSENINNQQSHTVLKKQPLTPFPLLPGENLDYHESSDLHSIYLTNYRLFVKTLTKSKTNSNGYEETSNQSTNSNNNLLRQTSQQSKTNTTISSKSPTSNSATINGNCNINHNGYKVGDNDDFSSESHSLGNNRKSNKDSQYSRKNQHYQLNQNEQLISLPINNIDSVEIRDPYFLIIYTKYIESFVLTFQSTESTNNWFKKLSDKIQDVEIKYLFCFHYFENLKNKDLISYNQYVIEELYQFSKLFQSEFARMKFDLKSWRLTDINKEFKFCNSYPQCFIVPFEIKDSDLESVANFRYSRRIPVVVWRSQQNGCVILRSSQPVVGWLGWRCNQDEKMLQNILKICVKEMQIMNRENDQGSTVSENSNYCNGKLTEVDNMANHINGDIIARETNDSKHQEEQNGQLEPSSQSSSDMVNGGGQMANGGINRHSNSLNHSREIHSDLGSNKLLILDARSYTAAFANRAIGGGCECPEYYTSCDVQFMSLNNIHSIRKSFYSLRYICELSQIDQANWFTMLDNTKWLHNLASLIKSANVVVDAISIQERPVLVHCSDGWDRTPQVVALAELMLDPYYRTLNGFKILVEKEWLQFGHKFADRSRSSVLNIDPNERCPVFLQWVDCVHQLVKQFPHEFEFNVSYLMKLVHHSYSCLFGTFTCNNVQERIENKVYDKTISLWAYFALNRSNFVNYLYQPKQEVLRPSCRVKDIIFWNEVYVPVSNPNNINTSVTSNLIPCNTICNGNYTSNSINPPKSETQYRKHSNGLINQVDQSNIIDFSCEHEIRCQSQSKCDLNRSASYESLYSLNSDFKMTNQQSQQQQELQFQHQLHPRNLIQNLNFYPKTHQRHHQSDSCLFERSHSSLYSINAVNFDKSPYLPQNFNFESFDLNFSSINSAKKTSNIQNDGKDKSSENKCMKNQYQQKNQDLNYKNFNIDISSVDEFSLDNDYDGNAIFDLDGQIIGTNNTQIQLEKLIIYHKKMIRCLTNQLKCKQKK